MAVAFVNKNYASATTVPTATHAIGDRLVIATYGTFSTIPSLGSGFTSVSTNSGNGAGSRVGQRLATATNDSSGTWTSSSASQNINYSGSKGVGASAFASGSSTTITYPTITMQEPGTSWILRLAWHLNGTNFSTATMTGFTRRSVDAVGTGGNAIMWDSNGPAASAPALAQSAAGGSNTWQAWTIEILASTTGTMGATLQNATFAAHEPYPAVSTLTDTFTDLSAWTIFNAVSAVGGSAVITTSGSGSYIRTNQTYTLTGSSVVFKVGSLSTTNTETQNLRIGPSGPGFLITSTGSGAGTLKNDASAGSVAYNPATNPYLRVSESGGTLTYEYGADGVSWTTHSTQSVGALSLDGYVLLIATGSSSSTFTVEEINPIVSPPSGTIAAALTKALFAGSGAQTFTGTAAATAQAATAALTGAQTYTGTLAATLQIATAAAAGTHPYTGTLAAAARAATFAGSGGQSILGFINASVLQAATFAGSGNQPFSGAVSALLRAAVMAASGSQSQTGTAAMLLQAATIAAIGDSTDSTALSAQIQAALFDGSGDLSQSAAIASQLRPAVYAGTGGQEQTGTVAATARPAVASLTGAQAQSGSIAVLLQLATMLAASTLSDSGTLAASIHPAIMVAAALWIPYPPPPERINRVSASARDNRVSSAARSNLVQAIPRR